MAQEQINDLWKVTNGIRTDVGEIKVAVARMEERGIIRDTQVSANAVDIQKLQHKIYMWIGATVAAGYILQTLTQFLMP
tara:strand:- start:2188 stop:2424 length:237 start_codon:yes stop_codon:yes gene_type:complete